MNKKSSLFITSTKPSIFKLKIYAVIFFFINGIVKQYLKSFFYKIEIEGKEHLQGGAKLLLMNHSCPLDPLLITFFGGRPTQFLITEAFMQGRFSAKIASMLGQIAKRKLDFDTSSIRLMKKWCEQGALVATFPEGQFSWDGKPSPLMPGIDQLVQYLDVPVVTAHLSNGEKVKPAWAKNYRKTSIKITINPQKKFEKGENIAQYIEDKIFFKSKAKIQFESVGNNLSSGLKKILRYCPSCHSDGMLLEIEDNLECSQCLKSWTITADNKVLGEKFKEVSDLFNNLYEILDKLWTASYTFKSVSEVEIINISKGAWKSLDKGQMELKDHKLIIGSFTLSLKEIQSHTLDWGDLIILKTRLERFAIKLPSDSRAIVSYLLDKEIKC